MSGLLLSYYVVDFDPFAFRFPEWVGLAGIRWYGLSYLAGFFIGVFLFNLYSKKGKSPLSQDDNSSFIVWLLFGVIIGGRLGYMLFYDFSRFCENPLLLFQIWRGGMASHGGFIGVVAAMFLFGKFRHFSFWTLSDIVCASCSPGIFLGRMANFINGELWGKISSVSWAMIFPNSAPSGTPIAEIAARHPSQLYEALGEGLVLFVYMQWRFWRGNAPRGQISGEFLALYGIIRIVCEIFREPDAGVSLILGLSRGSFYSIFAIICGIGIIACTRFAAVRGGKRD